MLSGKSVEEKSMDSKNRHNLCVVLGGCGFLGSVITRRMVDQGWRVRVFDKEGTDDFRLKPVRSKIEIIRGDFMNAGDIRRALQGSSTVLHFVGTTIPQTSMEDIDHDLHTNVLGTVRLLEVAREMKVERFIFSSSGGTVYGVPREFRPLRETDPTDPISAYGISKLMVEKYIHLFYANYRLPYVILRFSNPYGESQSVTRPQGAVSVMLDKALKGEEIQVWGDGSVVRDYLYEEDLAEAVESVLEHPRLEGIFNVGTGKGTSLNQLVDMIQRTHNVDVKVTYTPSRTFDVPYNVLDISKIGGTTGWKPQHFLQERIAAMGRNMKATLHGR